MDPMPRSVDPKGMDTNSNAQVTDRAQLNPETRARLDSYFAINRGGRYHVQGFEQRNGERSWLYIETDLLRAMGVSEDDFSTDSRICGPGCHAYLETERDALAFEQLATELGIKVTRQVETIPRGYTPGARNCTARNISLYLRQEAARAQAFLDRHPVIASKEVAS